MSKLIKTGFEAKQAIKEGVDIAANAIKVTLGPTGKAVILDRGYGSPTISDDGVTVAKDIELEDKFQNIGVSLIQEVANKTNEDAGDGTTTATVIAQKMIEEAFSELERNTYKANDLKRGMDKAARFVVDELNKVKKEVTTREGIEQVATISSLDSEVGKLIAEAMEEVGNDGVITVEEGQSIGIEKEVVQGMRFDKGFVSSYMVTNTERMEAVWEDPYILITDKKVSSVQDVLPLLEKIAQSGKKELVIIADDVEGEALTTFVLNKLRGTFNVLAVKAPGFGDRRKEMLQDIAVLTGGTVITSELGLSLDKTEVNQLGRARKVVATKEHTTIVDGSGDSNAITDRVNQIKSAIKEATSDFDKEKLMERMARLAGGIGVIKVGAFTETEMKAKKFKIEDALNATRAAVEEGIVAGGGAALAKIAPILEDAISGSDYFQENEKRGAMIVRKSLEAPMRQIAENAGAESSAIIKFVQQAGGHAGYDFANYDEMKWEEGKKEDMIAAGIVDPVKVTRLALENAISIASTLVTTETIIVDKPEPKSAPEMGGGMPGGMGGMGF
ncbi:TPA: chaperonin GroEL [Patescibacteria group bacterium]|jgi:chaperonin GroEL|nr:chaperonin GroEL [Patescibacteria group bacterium]